MLVLVLLVLVLRYVLPRTPARHRARPVPGYPARPRTVPGTQGTAPSMYVLASTYDTSTCSSVCVSVMMYADMHE